MWERRAASSPIAHVPNDSPASAFRSTRIRTRTKKERAPRDAMPFHLSPGPAPQHNHGALAVIFGPATPDQAASSVPRIGRTQSTYLQRKPTTSLARGRRTAQNHTPILHTSTKLHGCRAFGVLQRE